MTVTRGTDDLSVPQSLVELHVTRANDRVVKGTYDKNAADRVGNDDEDIDDDITNSITITERDGTTVVSGGPVEARTQRLLSAEEIGFVDFDSETATRNTRIVIDAPPAGRSEFRRRASAWMRNL